MPALFESGFAVREPSWHGLEHLLTDYPGSWEEAMKIAELDWGPVWEPLYFLKGMDNDGNPVYEEQEGYHRVVKTTGQLLDVRPDTTLTITNAEMGQIVEKVLDEPNVLWETAGAIDNGRGVYCLAKLDEPWTVHNDASQNYTYIVVLNRHDGMAACRIQATNIRVVCANTFSAAEAEGDRSGHVYSFNHTKNWEVRRDQIVDALKGVREQTAVYAELANHFAKRRVSKEKVSAFLSEFIPMPPAGTVSDRVMTNVEEAQADWRGIYGGTTVEGAGISGTAYGVLMASTEWLDHFRGFRNQETYFGRTMLRPEMAKAKAIRIIKETCGV